MNIRIKFFHMVNKHFTKYIQYEWIYQTGTKTPYIFIFTRGCFKILFPADSEPLFIYALDNVTLLQYFFNKNWSSTSIINIDCPSLSPPTFSAVMSPFGITCYFFAHPFGVEEVFELAFFSFIKILQEKFFSRNWLRCAKLIAMCEETFPLILPNLSSNFIWDTSEAGPSAKHR